MLTRARTKLSRGVTARMHAPENLQDGVHVARVAQVAQTCHPRHECALPHRGRGCCCRGAARLREGRGLPRESPQLKRPLLSTVWFSFRLNVNRKQQNINTIDNFVQLNIGQTQNTMRNSSSDRAEIVSLIGAQTHDLLLSGRENEAIISLADGS